ncbi:MAG: substrate-binding domain-containing protein, partial [Spirochaetales bacterium]|nr:substrate-binding domain-containing protein [Spirochaetales bacterium]
MRTNIAVLINHTESDFHINLLSGVTDYAQENNINLLLYVGGLLESPYTYEQNRNLIYSYINPRDIDGIVFFSYLVAGSIDRDAALEFCKSFDPIPVISIGRDFRPTPSIVIDNSYGIKALMAHFIEDHGFKRIAFIRGPLTSNDAMERHHEYIQSLTQYNLPYDANLVVQGEYGQHFGLEAVRILLDERQESFDALITSNDDVAMGAIDELRKRNISVPGDIAVAGFDNIKAGESYVPSITTINQPIYDLGRFALKRLHEHLLGGKQTSLPAIERYPAELVIRQSCGCGKNPVEIHLKESEASTEKSQTIPGTAGKSKPESVTEEEIKSVIQSFQKSVSRKDDSQFIPVWKNFIKLLIGRGYERVYLHNFLESIENHYSEKEKQKIYPLLLKAQWSIENVFKEFEAHRNIRILDKAFGLMDLTQAIQLTTEIHDQMDAMAIWLKRIGIQTCYMAIYEEPEKTYDTALLILALENGMNTMQKGDWIRFPAKQFLPNSIHFFQNTSGIFLVEPLFHGFFQIGYMVFNFLSWETNFYENLRKEVCGSLMAALYRDEIKSMVQNFHLYADKRINELKQSNDALKTELKKLKEIIVPADRVPKEQKIEDFRI